MNDTPSSHDPTAHGEVVAIRDATKRRGTEDLSGCEIYTTCEPCVAAIWWSNIGKMYYAATLEDCAHIGIDITSLVEEIARPLASRVLPAERSWARTRGPC